MAKYCYHCMGIMADDRQICSACGRNNSVPVPAHHLLPGTVLNNKFSVGYALGEGGFGITYIGRDNNLDIKVAIKEFYPNGFVNRSNTTSPFVNNSVTDERKDFFEKGRERFLSEARILAQFSGESGIVGVRDFFQENNTAYIVMEFLEGTNLKEYIRKNGVMTPDDTVKLLMPIMKSLKKVHDHGLIHRDISPDNIMVHNGKVKLLDFGAARNVSAIANKSLSIMLKPGYAPEEQYRSKGDQGPWTDIYAICATMYKCITGITPDDATQRVFSDEVKRPSQLGIAISPNMEYAIMRGLSVQQNDRFQTITELMKALKGENIPDNVTITDNRGFNSEKPGIYYVDAPKVQPVTPPKPQQYGSNQAQKYTPVTPKAVPQPTPIQQPAYNRQQEFLRANPYYNQGVNTAKAKNDKAKKLVPVIIVGAIVAIIAIIVVVAMAISSISSESSAKNPNKNSITDSAVDGLVMSEELSDFTFEIEGVVYKLPCKIKDFTDEGWEIDPESSGYDSEDTTVSAEEIFNLIFVKDDYCLEVELYNNSTVERKIKDCAIVGIAFEKGKIEDTTIAKGITPSSTVDDIINAFGTPDINDYDEEYGYTCLAYTFSQPETHFVYIEIYDDGVGNNIVLYCCDMIDSDSAVSDEYPDYLYDYVAPTSIGTDLFSGVVSIDGCLYQLPAPISEFISDGWSLDDETTVLPDTKDYVVLEKDGAMLYCTIRNYSDKYVRPENCAVVGVAVEEVDGVDIQLPVSGGVLTLGTTADDFDSLLYMYDYEYFETNDTHCYDVSQDECYISVDIDKESSVINNINIANYKWNY